MAGRLGVAALVPAAGWLRGYQRRWLGSDVVAGLAAGAVVVPQAMAYATIADLPVQVGLYTCMVPMLVYVLVGGSRTMSVSTTSTVAILTGTTLVSAGVLSGSDDPAGDVATLTLLVGLVLLLARALRLGAIVDNISEATTVGVKIGVGLTVAAGQLPKVLGIAGDPDASAFFGELAGVVEDLGDVDGATLGLSVVTLAVLLGLQRVVPKVPAPLVAVALGILAVAVLGLDEDGVRVIAEVPSGLPAPTVPSFDRVGALAGGAFAIAMMCFLESAAVANAVRRADEPPIDNDRELAANGLSCAAGAFFQAMPSAGGFSQTAINQGAGAVTQVAGLVTVLLAVACALFLGGVLSDLPEATLGCMVLVAVIGLIQPAALVRFWRLSRLEFWVATVTAASGLVFGLLVAVLVGVLLTLYLVLRELDHLGVTELQPAGDDVVVAGGGSQPEPGLLILRVDGPLYSANVRRVSQRIRAAVGERRPSVLVLDLTAVAALPVAVVDVLADLRRELTASGVELWVAALPPRSLATAVQLPEWEAAVAEGRVHDTALAAVRAHRART